MRIILLDNYDSCVFNVFQYLGELGAKVDVYRNDKTTVKELLAKHYDRCVVSPGPCRPEQAGITLELVKAMPEAGVPTLGICLGHQAIAMSFGGSIQLNPPMHGKATTVEHDGKTIFKNLPMPLTVGRYHSLVVNDSLPDCLEESARGGGVLMGLRHRTLPVEGVQFHPESILTPNGKELISNFMECS